MNTDKQLRKLDFVEKVTSEIEDSLKRHFSEIENDAVMNMEAESDKPAIAKAGISLQWEAGAESPEVAVRLSWSVRKIDESTIKVNDKQTAIEFDGKAVGE